MIDWTQYPNFTPGELACKCGCGRVEMAPDFMAWLQELRAAYGKGMQITSGYRCPDHNSDVSHTGEAGPHTTGRAVDVAVRGEDALTLMALAVQMGCRRVGVSQKGEGRFLHLDLCNDPAHPPGIWSY